MGQNCLAQGGGAYKLTWCVRSPSPSSQLTPRHRSSRRRVRIDRRSLETLSRLPLPRPFLLHSPSSRAQDLTARLARRVPLAGSADEAVQREEAGGEGAWDQGAGSGAAGEEEEPGGLLGYRLKWETSLAFIWGERIRLRCEGLRDRRV